MMEHDGAKNGDHHRASVGSHVGAGRDDPRLESGRHPDWHQRERHGRDRGGQPALPASCGQARDEKDPHLRARLDGPRCGRRTDPEGSSTDWPPVADETGRDNVDVREVVRQGTESKPRCSSVAGVTSMPLFGVPPQRKVLDLFVNVVESSEMYLEASSMWLGLR